MKYEKGTFIVVPNILLLEGKPSEMQAIYMWICTHSDDSGSCFPTKARIARAAGCSHNTVDKYLKQLVEEGFLSIEQRKKKGSKENTSNLYQIMVLSNLGGPTTNSGTTPPPNIGSETIPIINQTHLTKDTPPPKLNRMIQAYKKMYVDKYGPTISFPYGLLNKTFAAVIKDYSELQIIALLVIFFSWAGITGQDKRDEEYYKKQMYPIFLFKANLHNYEVYARNVLGWKEDFDNPQFLTDQINKHMLSLK